MTKPHAIPRLGRLGPLLAFAALLAGCSHEAMKEAHLKRAGQYFAAQRFEEAFIEYKNILRMEPTNYVAIRNLGMIYHEQGLPLQAFAFLSQAKKLDPEDIEVRVNLGKTMYTGRKFKESRDEAAFVLERQPTNTQALILLADTATTSNEMAATYAQLEKLRPVAGGAPGFHLAFGTMYFREGKTNEAEVSLRRALAVDANSSTAYSGLGNVAWARNDLNQAGQCFAKAAELSPHRSSHWLRLADFKLKTKDVEGGRAVLEEIARKAPDYVPAWMRLAELAYGQKRYDDCDELARRILGRDPNNLDAMMLVGQVKLTKGEAAAAVVDYQKIASVYPNLPHILHKLAMSQLLNRDMSGAMASLNQAVKASPNYPEAVLLLAELNVRRGDPTSAIILLNRLIQARPDIAKAHLLLAGAYMGRGSKDSALTVYRNMTELFPDNPQPPLLMGMLLLQQGQTNMARASFEKALELSPDYLPAVEQLVNLDLVVNQVLSALARARGQVDKNPAAALPNLLVAKVEMARTNLTQVETALTKAIQLDPNLRAPYMMLARLYVDSNKHEEALRKLESVVAADPQDVTALMQIGMIYDQLGQFDKARQTYERLIAVNPRFSPALNNLAYLYSERFKELDKAYIMARNARELTPADPFAADTLGWILYQRGEYPWALSLLQESAEKLPAEPEVLYHLGKAHYMMGEESSARALLERARQFDKEFKGKEDIARSLTVLNIDTAHTPPEVVRELEQSLAQHPADQIVLARLGAIYDRAGAVPKAVQAYESALRVNPNNTAATIELARIYADRLHDKNKALALAKAARNQAPDDPRVAHVAGRLAFDAGDHVWAHSLLQDSARNPGVDAGVWHDLAWAQFSVGKVSDALGSMRKALQSQAPLPQLTAASNFVAMTEVILHPENAEAAGSKIRQVLEAAPEFAPALVAQGIAQLSQGKHDAARVSFRNVLKIFPRFAPADKYLALSLVETRSDLKAASDHARKAREALPEDAEAAKALGLVSYQQKDFTRCVQLLREASAQRASDADILFHLGMACFQLKQTTECRAALGRALQLSPNGSLAAEAKKVLEQIQ